MKKLELIMAFANCILNTIEPPMYLAGWVIIGWEYFMYDQQPSNLLVMAMILLHISINEPKKS